jgi:uncharacterized protein (TIGR02996 family)
MGNAYQLPDWELLLKAVAASPDDDLPRLVAADWLDEHGEPERGEFIRLQIAREQQGHTEMAPRERGLLNNPLFGPLWAVEACPHIAAINFGSSLRQVDVTGAERVTFRRGFPFRVICTADEWLRFGGRIIPRQPVRELVLSRCNQFELSRWWGMKDTLRPLAKLTIDSPSPIDAAFIRDRICPGVRVCTADGPVEDAILTGRVGGSGEVGGVELHLSAGTPREVALPPRNDTPN